MKAILLGAERGVRRLQANDSYPLALVEDGKGRRAIDWVLTALDAVGVEKMVFVGGYHVEKLIASYPHFQFYYNTDWHRTESLYSLYQAREELVEDCIISHTNVLYHKEALSPLLDAPGDIVLGTFTSATASPANAFSSLVRVSEKGARQVADFFDTLVGNDEESYLRETGLVDFFHRLHDTGVTVNTVDISDYWVPIDANLNMAKFILSGKSETLERLQQRVSHSEILDQIRFSVADWRADEASVIKSIQSKFSGAPIVARSSARSEDSWKESQAGKYHSELNIDIDDEAAITAAIDKVIASFGEVGNETLDNVFVQRFLTGLKSSGVLFTRDIETQAPYLVINFDDVSGRSDSVTGGDGQSLATSYAFRGHENQLDEAVRPMAAVVREIEDLVDHDSLDIEFAIDEQDRCYILQVRPLTPKPGFSEQPDQRDIEAELESAADFLTESLGTHPLLQGATTVYSNMTDWNPAEIIGTTPRPLAATLYRHLVTDDVWAKSRRAMGGRDARSVPLMYMIGGHPYIDVRASLNSFIPASVSDGLTARLVDHFIARLSAEPRLHDKVEFDVALTCMDFDFENKSGGLKQNGFSADDCAELRTALTNQTAAIVKGDIQPFSKSRDSLARLAARRDAILQSVSARPASLSRAIGMLLDDCRKLGTFTFADLARQGFVASTLLQTLNRIGEIDDTALAELQASLPTVATDLADKLTLLVEGKISRDNYLAEFGHLRPGTYDILSPSYGEEPDLYLSHLSPIDHHDTSSEGASTFDDLMAKLPLDCLCESHKMGFTGAEMTAFIRQAIPGREWGKFEFSKSLSAALVLIKRLGAGMGFTPDDLSMLPIGKILDARTESSPGSWQGDLNREIQWNRKAFRIAKTLRFPSVITRTEELFGFTEREDWPNFITNKTITAPILHLRRDNIRQPNYDGRIIAIEHSDPGYDWIFGHKIAGLVTKYGGVASHMAIRCAEFGLPAAIGCGERVFDSVCASSVIELNCANRRISLVK